MLKNRSFILAPHQINHFSTRIVKSAKVSILLPILPILLHDVSKVIRRRFDDQHNETFFSEYKLDGVLTFSILQLNFDVVEIFMLFYRKVVLLTGPLRNTWRLIAEVMMKNHRVNYLAQKIIMVGLLHFERPRLQVRFN